MKKVLPLLKILIVFMTICSLCSFYVKSDEVIPIVQTKGREERPRTVAPIFVCVDREQKYIKVCYQGYTGDVYYSILDTISGQTIIGIASEDLGCYIWLDDKFSACILTFRLDDGSVYEGELLL